MCNSNARTWPVTTQDGGKKQKDRKARQRLKIQLLATIEFRYDDLKSSFVGITQVASRMPNSYLTSLTVSSADEIPCLARMDIPLSYLIGVGPGHI
jgi:hypothetical protein